MCLPLAELCGVAIVIVAVVLVAASPFLEHHNLNIAALLQPRMHCSRLLFFVQLLLLRTLMSPMFHWLITTHTVAAVVVVILAGSGSGTDTRMCVA